MSVVLLNLDKYLVAVQFQFVDTKIELMALSTFISKDIKNTSYRILTIINNVKSKTAI